MECRIYTGKSVGWIFIHYVIILRILFLSSIPFLKYPKTLDAFSTYSFSSRVFLVQKPLGTTLARRVILCRIIILIWEEPKRTACSNLRGLCLALLALLPLLTRSRLLYTKPAIMTHNQICRIWNYRPPTNLPILNICT